MLHDIPLSEVALEPGAVRLVITHGDTGAGKPVRVSRATLANLAAHIADLVEDEHVVPRDDATVIDEGASAFDAWHEKLLPQTGTTIKHDRGSVRLDGLGNVIATLNLHYGPLPVQFTVDEAVSLANAIRRLTAPAEIEE